MFGEMFGDWTLPIKFDLAANDDAFEKLISGNISNEEWSLDIDDFYADLFYQLDINVFVDYEEQSKIDLFGPLITWTSDEEKLAEDDYIVVDFHADADDDIINDITDEEI